VTVFIEKKHDLAQRKEGEKGHRRDDLRGVAGTKSNRLGVQDPGAISRQRNGLRASDEGLREKQV